VAVRKRNEGKRNGSAAEPPRPMPAEAYFVSAAGTDEEIRQRCAESIPDWSTMGANSQADTIRLMRVFWQMAPAPSYVIEDNGQGLPAVKPSGNVTLNTLRQVEDFGSESADYLNQRMQDIAAYHESRSGLATMPINASVAFVHGAKAEDPVQSSLAVQMAATHDAAMRALSKIGQAEWVEQVQLFGNLANKLLNTYTRQAETLAKLQRGGEQVIKHIHIDNRGGQAVVTDTVISGGLNENTRHQPDACSPALLGSDPLGSGVPITGCERQEALPDARRSEGVRGAEG